MTHPSKNILQTICIKKRKYAHKLFTSIKKYERPAIVETVLTEPFTINHIGILTIDSQLTSLIKPIPKVISVIGKANRQVKVIKYIKENSIIVNSVVIIQTVSKLK
jgi:hypothetical protein